MFLKHPCNHLGFKRSNSDPPFRIRTNSDVPLAIARISSLLTTGFSGPIQISHPDKFVYLCGNCRDCVRISHPDFPDQSGFRIRTNSNILDVIALISSHFTSEFSGQIRISYPDKFGYPSCDCLDFSAFHIRIFRTNPDFSSGQIRISLK